MYWIERNAKLDIDEQKIIQYLEEEKIEYKFFSKKQIIRNKIDLKYGDYIFGSIPSVFKSFDILKIDKPIPTNYPIELNEFYHRKIWSETLNDSLKNYRNNKNYFIKPKNDYKSFTGFLLRDNIKQTFKFPKKYGGEYEIDCSEEVNFISEFRCYIVNGKLEHIANYFGDEIDIEKYNYKEIIQSLLTNKMYHNTTLDIGITNENILSIIEHNASFSIDSYDCPYDIYSKLLINGWKEIYLENK